MLHVGAVALERMSLEPDPALTKEFFLMSEAGQHMLIKLVQVFKGISSASNPSTPIEEQKAAEKLAIEFFEETGFDWSVVKASIDNICLTDREFEVKLVNIIANN